jgi:hypothetical protein
MLTSLYSAALNSVKTPCCISQLIIIIIIIIISSSSSSSSIVLLQIIQIFICFYGKDRQTDEQASSIRCLSWKSYKA